MKGLPTMDEPHPDPPTWLAIHEFAQLSKNTVPESLCTIADEGLSPTEEARDWGRTESEVHAWRLSRAHGNREFFND